MPKNHIFISSFTELFKNSEIFHFVSGRNPFVQQLLLLLFCSSPYFISSLFFSSPLVASFSAFAKNNSIWFFGFLQLSPQPCGCYSNKHIVWLLYKLVSPLTLKSKQGRPPRDSEKGAVRCGWAGVASETTTYFRSIINRKYLLFYYQWCFSLIFCTLEQEIFTVLLHWQFLLIF